MAGRRAHLHHEQVRGGRVVVRQDVADVARVRAAAAHAAAHGGRVDAPHLAPRIVGGRAAQRHLGGVPGRDPHVAARGNVEGRGRGVVEDAGARAETGVNHALDVDIDRAAQHDDAQLALARRQRFGLSRRQAQRAEADVLPARLLRRDGDDLASLAARLHQQLARHSTAPLATLRSIRSTMRRSVS